MKPKINVLVCDSIHEDGVEQLKQAGFNVDLKTEITGDELKRVVSNYEVLIVRSRTKVTKDVINEGKKIKAIGRAGVGLDNIDLEAAKQRNIAVFNSPEAPAEAVAELAIGLMLSLARRIPFADATMKQDKWAKKELEGWELHGKTLGLIGLGNIGERVAKIARALGMKILITKRTAPDPKLLEALQGEFIPLKDLLARSDLVTIHIPLSPETRHMIGSEEFKTMKPGAYLINTARGEIVDEKALLDALKSGKLAGAALDVYEVEPPKNSELVKLPTVVCTPHIGSQTWESQRTASTILADKITAHFQKK